LFFILNGPKIQVERMRPQRSGRLKEALDMTDRFSAGHVFYGRTAAIMGAVVVLAVLIHIL
jgi:hypothetical protein